MHSNRRSVIGLLAGTIASPTALLAKTQWPTQPVRLVNNFPAGGPSDILARSISQVLQTSSKGVLVVENKPGAGGNIGAADVAKAMGDGRTLLLGPDSVFTINPHLYPNQGFKPDALKPVLVMATSSQLIGVHSGSDIRTLADLVSRSKSKAFNFSSGGSGSPGHLAIEVFNEATGHKLTHIPYRGNTPAVTAVVSAEVEGGMLATPGMLPHVRTGRIRALAVTSRQRSKLAPEIPTVYELGLPSLGLEVLSIVMTPEATPDSLVQSIAQRISLALQQPEVAARMTALDLSYDGQVGDAALNRLSELNERYRRIVQATGMRVD